MGVQVTQFAMHRNREARPDPAVHLLQLGPRRMPGHVDQTLAVSDDVEAEMDQPLLHEVHGPLVARNGARGVDAGIARIENAVRRRPEIDRAAWRAGVLKSVLIAGVAVS